MTRTTFWQLGAVLLLAGVSSAKAEIFTNGMFTNDASGWTITSYSGEARWVSSPGNPGGSVLLNSNGDTVSNPQAAQTVSLIVGHRYSVSVDVLLQFDNYNLVAPSFGIFIGSDTTTPLLTAGFYDSSWHTVNTSFVATAASETILFDAELDTRTPGITVNTDISYYIDNVTGTDLGATATPEPASFLLLGGAMSALLAFRRRLA